MKNEIIKSILGVMAVVGMSMTLLGSFVKLIPMMVIGMILCAIPYFYALFFEEDRSRRR